MKKAAKLALIRTIPTSLGCIFLGIVLGFLLQRSGLSAFRAFLISILVYMSSMQFALVGILTGGLSYMAVAVMALLINSRHALYGPIFIECFKEMKEVYPYMVFSSTDKTYSLLCSMARPSAFTDKERKTTTFFTAFFDQCCWIARSVLGAFMGELTAFDTTGIDLVMTTLLAVIRVDQRKTTKTHIPAATGFICSALFPVLIRSSNFILPVLAAAAAMLLFLRRIVEQKMEEDQTATHSSYILITILICISCTQITRWLPFPLLGGKKEVPGLVRYLGTNLPTAIMAVLVVCYLKGITPLTCPYGLPELISVAMVVGLRLWKGSTLSSVTPGAVCYMLLVQMVF